MNTEEIIQLAMEYGFTGGFDAQGNLTFDATFVEAVTEAVAKVRKATLEEMIFAHPTTAIKQAVEYEREACAKVCDRKDEAWNRAGLWNPTGEYKECAAAIRNRGDL